MIKSATIKQNSPQFRPEDIASLDPLRIPHHIAIIQDGSRRWAQQRSGSLELGHREGMHATVRTVRRLLSLA